MKENDTNFVQSISSYDTLIESHQRELSGGQYLCTASCTSSHYFLNLHLGTDVLLFGGGRGGLVICCLFVFLRDRSTGV